MVFDRDGIVFTVKNGQEMRNDKYNYDQFVNLSFRGISGSHDN